MVCALLLTAIAASAPHRPQALPIQARSARSARSAHSAHSAHSARPARPVIAAESDAPRLPSGYRSVRISLRWQAPER